MNNIEKGLLILQINTKLERLSKSFGQAYMNPIYAKIEAKVGTANIFWKSYEETIKDENGEIVEVKLRRVLGISRSKASIEALQPEVLKNVLQEIPTKTTVRKQHTEQWTEEVSASGSDITLDDFVSFTADIEQRIQRYLKESNYKSNEKGGIPFWNAMPRSADGSIITWERIGRELAKHGY